MLFNSIEFVIFISILFVLYWFFTQKNLKAQNFTLLVASYFFYGWWDWRFLGLIFMSTLVDFLIGRALKFENHLSKRKNLLWISILFNLAILCYFKYFNFFIDSFNDAFELFGSQFRNNTLNIILPIGISFYTFQTLSYSIDVYRRKIEPTNDFIVFAVFVSFFPQLVAGPIERASNLLPQFLKKREFDYDNAVDGMRQILWGIIKKIVIADNCGVIVDMIFNSPESYNGSTLLLGACLFSFQIYGDFSGYSDIAIGIGKLFGFQLMQNFNFPFFSKNLKELSSKWHISLTSWFKDYLYIPLGGNKYGIWQQMRNVLIVFVISGFWHGAGWNYVIWGLVTGILILLPFLKPRTTYKTPYWGRKGKIFKTINNVSSRLNTFLLFSLLLIIFRTKSLSHMSAYFSGVFTRSLFEIPDLSNAANYKQTIILVILFFIVEWMGREREYAIQKLHTKRPIRWMIYFTCLVVIFYFGSFNEISFIYFQF